MLYLVQNRRELSIERQLSEFLFVSITGSVQIDTIRHFSTEFDVQSRFRVVRLRGSRVWTLSTPLPWQLLNCEN